MRLVGVVALVGPRGCSSRAITIGFAYGRERVMSLWRAAVPRVESDFSRIVCTSLCASGGQAADAGRSWVRLRPRACLVCVVLVGRSVSCRLSVLRLDGQTAYVRMRFATSCVR